MPSAKGEHVLSLIIVATLAAWAIRRFGLWGLLVPGLVISYSELQFMGLTLLYYGVVTKWFLIPAFGLCLILFGLKFRRIPKYVLVAGLSILLLDFADGFRISWGFVPGDPYLHDPYTNAKEILGWGVVCFSAFLDTPRVSHIHRDRSHNNTVEADGILGK